MKIAGVQFSCSEDKERNTEKACKMMDMAHDEGAEIVCFQELFNLHWFPRNRDGSAFAMAEEITGRTVGRMREKARECASVVVLPFFEREEGAFYNSCAVIDADGEMAGIYRKIHLPDIPLWEEKFYFSAGNLGFPVFSTRYGRIGVQISWDNLFPEGSRILALKGADIVFAPTACAFKSQHIWQTVITSNAITNGFFVMRVNRVGSEGSHDFYGMSFSASPEGEMIGGPTGRADGIMLADIDHAQLAEIRREWPIIKERRPDLYAEIL
ncbi:MAG: nitrilase-related carbon-nitrogen hydrolase [Syntrophorhabdales bacterium]|jgi:N-carbamoylputrescine amidase